ncbi:MAG: ABC transporter ATP-binding protein [Euryarchaeota archaeon]|nr:ABC transporter ATP-binding protein [Euryarchaeota archaeon]
MARATTSHAQTTPGDPFVVVEGLGKRYGANWAMKELTFDVRPGEIFGIIGPNGAGKSTTIKILAGLIAPTTGTVTVGGLQVEDPVHKMRIGYLPEESPLYEDMTPLSYLRFFAELYEVPRDVADRRIDDSLAALKLDVRDEKKIGDLSKGMRRKVAIARSLINDPDLLIYDEPASGLDPVASAYILDLVQELSRRGKTVVFSAHNLYHVERICDRVLIVRQGSVIAQGTMAEIRASTRSTRYTVTTDVPFMGAEETARGFAMTVTDFAEVHGIEEQVKDKGGRIIDVREEEVSLEEIFLRHAAN